MTTEFKYFCECDLTDLAFSFDPYKFLVHSTCNYLIQCEGCDFEAEHILEDTILLCDVCKNLREEEMAL